MTSSQQMKAEFPPPHVGNDLNRLWYYTTEDYKMKCAHGAEFPGN